MALEIEAKILDIDVSSVENKLKILGAERVGDFFFRSISFDFHGFPLDKESAWVRLRTDGKETTLAYKQRLGVSETLGKDTGMEEIEVVVSDYDAMANILRKIGMVEKFSQEKKRTTWKKGGTLFDIDTCPRIPTYLEVEGKNWEEVDQAILDLGFTLDQKHICSATQIYKMYGINDKDYTKLTFDEFVLRT